MTLSFKFGLESIRSFKRLPYTPWHALAEFVDNSTQSYLTNRGRLDAVYRRTGKRLRVEIDYSASGTGALTILDNAMGMSIGELRRALTVGNPPPDTTGRSRYGLGLKTAASWFGDVWTVETKRLGSTKGHRVEVDVEAVARDETDLPSQAFALRKSDHYTKVEIRKLNHPMGGRTKEITKDFLRSMYRRDLANGRLDLIFLGERLRWDTVFAFAIGADGQRLRKDVQLDVAGKAVKGWVGVLERGSRARAGFTILHSDRVVKGWPDAWRPPEIFGQRQGSNDLVNQRLVGEIELDDFEVSHTKDDILWLGDEEEEIGNALKTACAELISIAKTRRQMKVAPVPQRTTNAAKNLQSQLSGHLVGSNWLSVPWSSPDERTASNQPMIDKAKQKPPDFAASLDQLTVMGYLASDATAENQYIAVDSTPGGFLSIVINMNHPHVSGMTADVLLDHLQHCAFEALAEWKARNRAGTTDPAVIKLFKDSLFRLVAGPESSNGHSA